MFKKKVNQVEEEIEQIRYKHVVLVYTSYKEPLEMIIYTTNSKEEHIAISNAKSLLFNGCIGKQIEINTLNYGLVLVPDINIGFIKYGKYIGEVE